MPPRSGASRRATACAGHLSRSQLQASRVRSTAAIAHHARRASRESCPWQSGELRATWPGSLPPACAMSGRPPPPPPTAAATGPNPLARAQLARLQILADPGHERHLVVALPARQQHGRRRRLRRAPGRSAAASDSASTPGTSATTTVTPPTCSADSKQPLARQRPGRRPLGKLLFQRRDVRLQRRQSAAAPRAARPTAAAPSPPAPASLAHNVGFAARRALSLAACGLAAAAPPPVNCFRNSRARAASAVAASGNFHAATRPAASPPRPAPPRSARTCSAAFAPVSAVIRRVPADTPSSLRISNCSTSPVFVRCVPPHSSLLNVAHRHHPHRVGILLAEQHHRALLARLGQRQRLPLHRLRRRNPLRHVRAESPPAARRSPG